MAALEEQLDKLREEKQALEEANLRAELEKTQFRQAAERVAEEARQLKRRAEEQMRQAEERVRLLEEKANGSMAQSGEDVYKRQLYTPPDLPHPHNRCRGYRAV